MEAIGLNFNKTVEIMALEQQRTRDSVDEIVESSITRYIKDGHSQEEAVFKAEITAAISANATAILAVINANNQRLFSDLRGICLLNR